MFCLGERRSEECKMELCCVWRLGCTDLKTEHMHTQVGSYPMPSSSKLSPFLLCQYLNNLSTTQHNKYNNNYYYYCYYYYYNIVSWDI